MNSYQTINAAFAVAGLTKQQAVEATRYWEFKQKYVGATPVRSAWNAEDKARQLAVNRKEGAFNPVREVLAPLQKAIVGKLDRELFRDQSEDRTVKFLVEAYESKAGLRWRVIKASTRESWDGPFETATAAVTVAMARERGVTGSNVTIAAAFNEKAA